MLLAALATGALAQTKDDAGKRLEAIRFEMEKGQGLYLAGNYAGAAEVFEAGYTSHPLLGLLVQRGASATRSKTTSTVRLQNSKST